MADTAKPLSSEAVIDVRPGAPATGRAAVPCPICDTSAPFAYDHPEARIYRCPACTHAFSDQSSIRSLEEYTPEYYEAAHRNWFANPNYELFDWIERQIPVTATSIIDVGCGRGQFLDSVRTKRPNVRLVGVDLSENQNRDGIEFHCGDAVELDLGVFDAVVTMATIEHVTDVVAFTKLLHDLCAPGGLAIVMTIDDGSLLYRSGRFARLLGVPVAFNRLYSSHHLHHFNHKSLVTLVESRGLQVHRSLHHSVPLKALDLPVSPIARPLFLAAVKAVFVAGDLLNLSYLQTVVATRKD